VDSCDFSPGTMATVHCTVPGKGNNEYNKHSRMAGVCAKNLLKIEWNFSSHLSKCVGLSDALQSLQFPPRTGSTTAQCTRPGWGREKMINIDIWNITVGQLYSVT